MKKISIILLLGIYAMATMGFIVNQFYCCGKLSSISLTLTEKSRQHNEKSGCCENKSHFVKVKDNHVGSTEVNSPAKQFSDFHSFIPSIVEINSYAVTAIPIVSRSNAPPLHVSIPLYILHRVFIV